ncbi:MAG: MtnX-like HAD-IB family phosphatase [Candidatus Omnitrophota bacterium]
MKNKIKFFIDFDGTIAKVDVVDAVLKRFAPKQWKAIEAEWLSGKIGSRACLGRQIDLVRVSQKKLAGFLDTIEIDPHFVAFLKTCLELGIEVSVVSDGFDFIIDRVLKKALAGKGRLLRNLPVHSNRFEWRSGVGPKAVFSKDPCEHGCATCKVRVIRKKSRAGQMKIFIGDGFSDRHAAHASDLCFAKKRLLDYCRDNQLPHIEYVQFDRICEWLSDYVKTVSAGSQKFSNKIGRNLSRVG